MLSYGAEGGIRTLEELMTLTRFPIVRARPTTRLLHVWSGKKFSELSAYVLYTLVSEKSRGIYSII